MVMRNRENRGGRRDGLYMLSPTHLELLSLTAPRPVQGTFTILSWHPSPAACCSHSELTG